MNDDLISRQAAIEYFMTNTNWHDEDGYPIDDAEEKRELLEDYFNGISSAEPNCSEIPKKTGRWKSLFGAVGKVFECSECGAAVTVAYECFKDGCYYDYCPNCGARMRMEDVQNKY